MAKTSVGQQGKNAGCLDRLSTVRVTTQFCTGTANTVAALRMLPANCDQCFCRDWSVFVQCLYTISRRLRRELDAQLCITHPE